MRVKSDGDISVTAHIIPTTDSTYDLGSGTYKFRDIYVSENSIWVGDEFQLGVNEQGIQKKLVSVKERKIMMVNSKFQEVFKNMLVHPELNQVKFYIME